MKSPESFSKPEAEMAVSPESNEGLASIISTLQEIHTRYREFVKASDESLLKGKDSAGYHENLESAARLFVDLPEQIAPWLDGLDQEVKTRITDSVGYFSTTAQRVIEDGNDLGMGVLLTPPGSKMGDKDNLQKLIAYLKRKQGG